MAVRCAFPGEGVLQQHTTLVNQSDARHRFYWWTNAAVQVQDDSRLIYPTHDGDAWVHGDRTMAGGRTRTRYERHSEPD